MERLTLEQMRADIAALLADEGSTVAAGDNLADLGLDSIRIMTLAERWSRPGCRIEFDDLAAYPELMHWWAIVDRRQSQGDR
jgi:bifunctional isochorismate lyase/aryl carrier protein